MSEENNNAEEFSGGLAELRAEYKKLKAENKELRTSAMDTALGSLGLEADKGIGKAVSKMYDGPISVEAIKAYASEEFGLGDSEVAAQTKSAEQVVDNTVAAQQRVQNLQSLGVSDDAKDIFDTFKQVIQEADGDIRKSITAKLQMMEGLNKKE